MASKEGKREKGKVKREEILKRVRDAQRTGYVPLEKSVTIASRASAEPLLERFLRELKMLGVDYYVEQTAADVQTRVAALVEGRVVFSWDPDRLPCDAGKVFSGGLVTGRSSRAEQATAEIGVTGCHAAIAETGSLALLAGPGTPRAASLLPPVHVCIVKRGDLMMTMGEFFSARADDIAASACCTFVTGPSRTADIELTLTLGVHGPGQVVVVVGP
jgi:L-lactate dehydrogenase complex protein LldG